MASKVDHFLEKLFKHLMRCMRDAHAVRRLPLLGNICHDRDSRSACSFHFPWPDVVTHERVLVGVPTFAVLPHYACWFCPPPPGLYGTQPPSGCTPAVLAFFSWPMTSTATLVWCWCFTVPSVAQLPFLPPYHLWGFVSFEWLQSPGECRLDNLCCTSPAVSSPVVVPSPVHPECLGAHLKPPVFLPRCCVRGWGDGAFSCCTVVMVV